MVRRWSFINYSNLSLNFKDSKKFFFYKKIAKVKIFKSTVVARRFYKKYTKFRRKAFNRMKHRTNWLIYTNVFKFWSQDYLNNKYPAKVQFLTNFFVDNFFFFNFNAMKNKNPEIFFNWNFTFINLSQHRTTLPVLKWSIWTNSSNFLNSRKFLNNKSLSLGWKTDKFVSNELTVPTYSSWDQLWYLNDYSEENFKISLFFDFNLFYTNMHNIFFHKILIFYKILIFLNFTIIK